MALDIGVYFPRRSEFGQLAALGITWAVRPIITPDLHGNGDGFATEPIIVHVTDGYTVPYGGDDFDTRGAVRLSKGYNPGNFYAISNGRWGLNAGDFSFLAERGVENYCWPPNLRDCLSVPRGIVTALACAHVWRGRWTACVNVLYGGNLDAATSKGVVSVAALRWQLRLYRWLRVSRVFLWRWDLPAARAVIEQALAEI